MLVSGAHVLRNTFRSSTIIRLELNKNTSASVSITSKNKNFGAGNEARTRDLNLGKVALYQLSYSRKTGVIVTA